MILVSPILRLVLKIITLLIYIATALCCFGGYISPEITPMGSILTIGMPLMVTISAVVTLAWFCTGHWLIGAVGVLMFFVCASPIRTWFPLNHKQEANPDTPQFTLLTWNTHHFSDLEHPDAARCRTIDEILRIDADVVCLQETFSFSEKYVKNFNQAQMDSLMERYPYQLGDGTYDQRVLSKYPVRHIYFGKAYHYTLAEYFTIKIKGREIAIANVHLPSFALDEEEKGILTSTKEGVKERENLGKRIIRKFETAIPMRAWAAERVIDGFESLAMPVIVCGDFNDVPSSWTYRMFIKAGFKDAYTATNFFPTQTFWQKGLLFHLDQIFYRGSVAPLSVESIKIKTSDHYPLVATFDLLVDPYTYHPYDKNKHEISK